jgi:hypothetical protein
LVKTAGEAAEQEEEEETEQEEEEEEAEGSGEESDAERTDDADSAMGEIEVDQAEVGGIMGEPKAMKVE